MTGNFIDTLRFSFRSPPQFEDTCYYHDTDFGKIRVLDTGGAGPVFINVPDGPNVIEHQLPLIKKLSKHFRVLCFEYPGLGFSYPNAKYDYSIETGTKLLIQMMDSLNISRASLLFSCSNGLYAMNAAS